MSRHVCAALACVLMASLLLCACSRSTSPAPPGRNGAMTPPAAAILPPPDVGYGTETACIGADPEILQGMGWSRVQNMIAEEARQTVPPKTIPEANVPHHRQAVEGLPEEPMPPEGVRWLALWYREPQSLLVGNKSVRGRVIILYGIYGAAAETSLYVGSPGGRWHAATRLGENRELYAWSEDFRNWLRQRVGPP
ncbi:MAG: hypothetical protein K6T75_03030 [Acetobacteraceae bacterium]|nr:hypothetical protein [Acetobacteraceae bacterium]